MAEPGPAPQASTPQATVRRSRRLRLSPVWLVPIIAAAVGGYLFYQSEIDVGPTVEIGFADGTNIAKGSKVVYRGVEVGTVQSVELDSGLQHVNVAAQLHKPAAGLAREGSQFWIVEPRVSVGQVTGLDTLLSGSYIQVAPGDGAEATRFVGLANPPVLSPGGGNLVIFLESDDAASLAIGSPILYRGIGVGEIAAVSLPQDGSRVQLEAAIKPEHAPLVRTNSVFWRTSGVHFDLQPLDPKIDISSVESLIRGGVAFATPVQEGTPVKDRSRFVLHDHSKDEWLAWQPAVLLAPAATPMELAEGFSVEDLAPATFTVTTTSHVREGPDTTYPVLTTLSEDTTVSVTGKVEGHDWYRVEVGGAAGYIWAKLLAPAQTAQQE